MTRTDNRTLCEICEDIDFDKYLGKQMKRPINLGTWGSIVRRTNCRFCRLVVHCLRSDASLTPDGEDTDVFLENKLSWELGIELSPYDRMRSESYSNKFDLRSRARQCRDTAYRFLISTGNENSARKGMIQYLAHMEKDQEARQFYGRKILPERVDTKLLISWLHRCWRWHGEECDRLGSAADELPHNLRLIDVVNRCIVRAPMSDCPDYVALSYVWGTQQMKSDTGMEPARLERANIKPVPGGERTPLPATIPLTIKDAISVTHSLGFRYLWNDALCIVQDDPDDQKALHLSHMHAIYSCALLTIAAAAGNHADYGLPGISAARKHAQYSERIRGLRLATMFPSYSSLENSRSLIWNTRGWTFQEKLLSKRILLFTDYQVYFKCSESIWTEEVCMETGRLSKSVETRAGKYRWAPDRRPHTLTRGAAEKKVLNANLNVQDEFEEMGGFLDYSAAVHEYTTRTLTEPKDGLFAIKGVLNTLKQSTGEFFFALPQAHMLESLLWFPEPGTIQTRTPNDNLPSWSWISWQFQEGWVSHEITDARGVRDLANYTFEEVSSGAERSTELEKADASIWVNLIEWFKTPILLQGHTVERIYYCMHGHARQLDFELPMGFLTRGKIGYHIALWIYFQNDPVSTLVSLPWWKHLFQKTQDVVEYKKKNLAQQTYTPSRGALAAPSPALLFESTIVSFCIGAIIQGRYNAPGDEVGVFELLDASKLCVGEVWTTHGVARYLGSKFANFLSLSWSLRISFANIHPKYLPRWRHTTGVSSTSEEGKQYIRREKYFNDGLLGIGETFTSQFLGWSIPEEWKAGARTKSKDGSAGKLFHAVSTAEEGEPLPRSLWAVVNLILVDWDGRTARRLGVGKVIMSAWEDAKTPAQEVIFV
jgi:Heterokaryon incompatibility protein (HET)